MVGSDLTDAFDNAEGEITADNMNAEPQAEQVALSLHGIMTRLLSISPESAAGLCNAVGQASCLLSSVKIPEDSLQARFKMSAAEVQDFTTTPENQANWAVPPRSFDIA